MKARTREDGPADGRADLTALSAQSALPAPSAISAAATLSGGPGAPHVLIIHEVADYAAWKAIFDEAAGIRREAGEIEYRLLAFDTDAARIVHFSRWTDLAAARAFFESPELVEIRRKAGIRAPEFHYLNAIESGVLKRQAPDGLVEGAALA